MKTKPKQEMLYILTIALRPIINVCICDENAIKSKECLNRVPVFSKIHCHSSPWDQFHVTGAFHMGVPKNI